MTKEECTEQFINCVKELEQGGASVQINLSKVQNKLKWDKEKTNEILKIFDVKKII